MVLWNLGTQTSGFWLASGLEASELRVSVGDSGLGAAKSIGTPLAHSGGVYG